eukprot:3982440-Alexandrium_andersonii.AAC.1
MVPVPATEQAEQGPLSHDRDVGPPGEGAGGTGLTAEWAPLSTRVCRWASSSEPSHDAVGEMPKPAARHRSSRESGDRAVAGR